MSTESATTATTIPAYIVAFLSKPLRFVLEFLYDHRDLAGVAALYATSLTFLNGICAFIAAHPFISFGLLVLYFLPNIFDGFADWLGRLRIALDNLSLSWNSDITPLRSAVDVLQSRFAVAVVG